MNQAAIEKVETSPVTIVQESAVQIDLPLPIAADIVVVAKNSSEMASSKERLVQWALGRIAGAESELLAAQDELAKIVKMKQRTASFKRKVDEATDNVVFYKKLHAALEAGYCIVPEFPIQIIAVRVTSDEPVAAERKVAWGGSLPEVASDSAPVGEGRYVSPHTKNITEKRPVKDEGTTERWRVAKAFQKVDFPARLARMEILDSLDTAQRSRIFDAIGVLPSTSRPRSDPMLIGRIEHKSENKMVYFMIAWWLDTKTL
jgi:hypothetical protein